MYELKATAGFDAALTEENTAPGIVTLKLTAKSETAKKLEIRVKWYTEDIGVNAVWSPLSYRNKTVRPDWGGYYDSNAMRSCPVFSNVAFDDTNRMTIACPDAKNSVKIRCGVVEGGA